LRGLRRLKKNQRAAARQKLAVNENKKNRELWEFEDD